MLGTDRIERDDRHRRVTEPPVRDGSYAVVVGMARQRWRRGPLALVLAAAIAATLLAGLARADSVAHTGATTNLSPTSATVSGTITTSEPDGARYFFEYGTGTAYGQTTPVQTVSTGTSQVSAQLVNLTPATTYHYQLVVTQATYTENNLGGDQSFTTPGAPDTSATTGQATSVGSSSAVLNGVTNPNGSGADYYFEYGKTTSYGHMTEPRSLNTGFTVVFTRVSGLKARTTYHFRLVVEESNPATSAGQDQAFTTLSGGRVELRSHYLRFHDGSVSVPINCEGPHAIACKGKLVLKAGGGRCGSVHLSAHGGQKQRVRIHASGGCAARVAKAHGHQLAGSLSGVFSTGQPKLHARVTLVGI